MEHDKRLSEPDRAEADAPAEDRPAEVDKQPAKKGLFRADELPPVPDWARRPPAADKGGLFATAGADDTGIVDRVNEAGDSAA